MNNLIINSAIKENHFKEKKENTEIWMNIFFTPCLFKTVTAQYKNKFTF